MRFVNNFLHFSEKLMVNCGFSFFAHAKGVPLCHSQRGKLCKTFGLYTSLSDDSMQCYALIFSCRRHDENSLLQWGAKWPEGPRKRLLIVFPEGDRAAARQGGQIRGSPKRAKTSFGGSRGGG